MTNEQRKKIEAAKPTKRQIAFNNLIDEIKNTITNGEDGVNAVKKAIELRDTPQAEGKNGKHMYTVAGIKSIIRSEYPQYWNKDKAQEALDYFMNYDENNKKKKK